MNPFDTTDNQPDSDRDYYYHRAEAALEMAQRSAIPAAVNAHYVLAGHYLDKAYAPGEITPVTADNDDDKRPSEGD